MSSAWKGMPEKSAVWRLIGIGVVGSILAAASLGNPPSLSEFESLFLKQFAGFLTVLGAVLSAYGAFWAKDKVKEIEWCRIKRQTLELSRAWLREERPGAHKHAIFIENGELEDALLERERRLNAFKELEEQMPRVGAVFIAFAVFLQLLAG